MYRKSLIFVLVCLLADFCPVSLAQPDVKEMDLYRLPETVKPVAYDLTLHLSTENMKNGTSSGFVKIDIDAAEDVEEVLVHSNGLTVEEVKLNGESAQFKIDTKFELIHIEAPQKKGAGVLEIKFTASMVGKLVGMYSSKYLTPEGTNRSIATTKFEPTYARQAFPCFDEPNLKANFSIHIVKPKDADYIALSNMPVKSEEEVEDGILVSFEESVKMPTYLACWVVSDFKSTNDVIKSDFPDIPYRVFATPAQLPKTDYAAKVGKKVMEFYLDYFQIPFPLPKLDMLAIPDYSSGATEHWGIVTYRETSLLFDYNLSTSVNKRRVATVIAHELAHSWFGNLVTMDWWNDLWLNEGFASYIEYKGIDAAEPTWKMMDQFVLDDMNPVMVLDSTLASHPIVQVANTPDEITSLFDTISYAKGASVLRMVENSIGNETFREGVTNYLNKHAFGNAVTQQLLDEFQKLVPAEYNLTNYLNTWTVQMGYPIINVARTEDGFRLTQKRFLTDPDKVDPNQSPYDYKWIIPVTYFTAEDREEKQVWFNHTDPHLDVKVSGKFVKFNGRQIGYYRVNYEPEVWANLIENIKDMEILDRSNLLEDSFRIADANQLAYEIPLNLTQYLKEELDYVPWAVANHLLKQLTVYLSTSKYFADYKQYVVDLVMPAVNNYTWNLADDDSTLTRLSRLDALGLACYMDDESCLSEARSRLSKFLYEGVPPSPDLKELAYKYGMTNGNAKDWDKLWEKFVEATDAAEKISLLRGLTAVKDPALIHKLLDLAKDETYIRNQDYPSLISFLSANPAASQIVWIYFRENWDALVKRFGLNDRYLHGMIPSVTSGFTTNTQREELLAFYAANPEVGSGEAARKRALETVNNNINWVARNLQAVETWIENNKQ